MRRQRCRGVGPRASIVSTQGSPAHGSVTRPTTIPNHLNKLYELTLPSKAETASDDRLPPEVPGLRAGRQPNDVLDVIHKVRAKAMASGEGRYVGKTVINKTFDNIDLDLAETAAQYFTDDARARAFLAGHRKGGQPCPHIDRKHCASVTAGSSTTQFVGDRTVDGAEQGTTTQTATSTWKRFSRICAARSVARMQQSHTRTRMKSRQRVIVLVAALRKAKQHQHMADFDRTWPM